MANWISIVVNAVTAVILWKTLRAVKRYTRETALLRAPGAPENLTFMHSQQGNYGGFPRELGSLVHLMTSGVFGKSPEIAVRFSNAIGRKYETKHRIHFEGQYHYRSRVEFLGISVIESDQETVRAGR